MIAAEELCGALGIGGVAPIDHHRRID